MSSTFKNRIPKRKYRERVQPSTREKLGFLQKKKDYKIRAKNYHEKQDMLHKMKHKARMKNEDQFYFKMVNSKKNEDGKLIEDDDSDFDEAQYRLALKKENYSLILNQRSIMQNKIEKLKAELQLISEQKPSTHKIFVENEEQLKNFQPSDYYKTDQELIENNMLEVNPEAIKKEEIDMNTFGGNLKDKYNRLNQYIEREETLTKLLLKLGYEKNLLGKERKKIKKFKKEKVHKFFLQRKK